MSDENSGYCGFVTRFEIDSGFAERYDVQVAGSARTHRELWVPAEELEVFNGHLRGLIEVIASHYGDRFEGTIDPLTNLPADLPAPSS
ncbi:MAG: hypothetical protein AAGI91_03255 [Bacteroidota bacterium]